MNAEIISVGTEILLGQIDNTHARFLSLELASIGIAVYFHTAVGDNINRLQNVLETAMKRSQIIILTGGLGPTDDDLTRDAVAQVSGLPLRFSEAAFSAHVAPVFARLGVQMPEINRRQAFQIGEAEFLPNERGTAPGQYVQQGGVHIFLLPGPPLEMRPMFLESVRPRLLQQACEGVIYSRVLRLFGIGESDAETRIKDLLLAQGNPTIAPLASEGEMVLRLTAKAASEAEARTVISPIHEEIMRRLGNFVYGYDDDTLPVVACRALRERSKTLALAETCTGGLLSSMLVDIPGSSAVLKGGIVAYANSLKAELLSVEAKTLEQFGAVSEAAAMEMAKGARTRLGADYGLSISGIAGPSGGTAEKPAGLVFLCVAGPNNLVVKRRNFTGDRQQVRIRAAKTALHLLLQQMDQI